MAVVLDTQLLIWGGVRALPDDESDRPEMAERAHWLISNLERDNIDIIVPAIVAAELAVPVPSNQRGAFLASLSELFIVKPFDLHTAAIAAELRFKAKTLPKETRSQRVVLSADVKIIATAKAAGASVFCSNDKQCRRIAELVMDARDLPTHAEGLYDSVPDHS